MFCICRRHLDVSYSLLAVSFYTFLERIFKKRFFSPQIVCMEATWAFVLLPFQIRKSRTDCHGALLIIRPSYSTRSLCIRVRWCHPHPFHPHVQSSGGICMDKYSTRYLSCSPIRSSNEHPQVFIYATGIILLALLTQFSYDQQVWARDIDSSPCPFPFPVLLVYAFPSAAEYVQVSAAHSREDPPVAGTNYCLPGCSCHTKPNDAPVLESQSANDMEATRSAIPIRVPTAMDRQNAIRVTLGQMAR